VTWKLFAYHPESPRVRQFKNHCSKAMIRAAVWNKNKRSHSEAQVSVHWFLRQ